MAWDWSTYIYIHTHYTKINNNSIIMIYNDHNYIYIYIPCGSRTNIDSVCIQNSTKYTLHVLGRVEASKS